jgi:PTS system N-acetylglucosamine-specific IIC component
VDACTTRLRLVVADGGKIDAQRLKALGARGIVKPSANAVQVVLGPIADQVAAEMRAFLARGGVTVERVSTVEAPVSVVKMPPTLQDGKAVLAALGGAANVRDVSVCSSRLRVGVARSEAVDEAALKASGARGVVKLGSSVHVVIGPAAAQLADALRMALA